MLKIYGIKVDLPQANNHPIESKDMPAMVTIGKDGNIYLQLDDYLPEVNRL